MPVDHEHVLISFLADGRFHSGEALAKHLGVSRTAVWKKLQAIAQTLGLEVDAVRGKGYRLRTSLEILNVDLIRDQLAHRQQELPELHLFASIPSTNNFFTQRLDQSLESGSCCLAEHQSQGRGRRGRQWISPYASNLYLSLYWKFDLAMSELGGLSVAVGAILANRLSWYTQGVHLKWPNDVMVNGEKLAGILVDVQGAADGPAFAVIGIGINLHMPQSAAQSIDQAWTDLSTHTNKYYSRNQLASELIADLHDAMHAFQHNQLESFIADWRRFDQYHGKQVTLLRANDSLTGTHKGIAHDGAILLDVDGQQTAYYSGEVSMRAGSM